MNSLTEVQLEILSKVSNLKGLANMDDLTNRGSNLEISGWEEEMRELFQKNFLEINGSGYRLTHLGIKTYECQIENH